MSIEEDILSLLKENARQSNAVLARKLAVSESEVSAIIERLEKEGLIRAYRLLLDEDAMPRSGVQAIIEVKVRPEREGGFDRIAARLSKFPEVESLYLVSGGYDLELEIRGETLQDVAGFVSSKLATIDGVISTGTHFILKRYKEAGVCFSDGDDFQRLKVSP